MYNIKSVSSIGLNLVFVVLRASKYHPIERSHGYNETRQSKSHKGKELTMVKAFTDEGCDSF